MKIILNGKEKQIPINYSVLNLISEHSLNPEKVIIQLNDKIITKELYETEIISTNSKVEILALVGGG